MSQGKCRFCGSSEHFEIVPGPHKGGHFAKVVCKSPACTRYSPEGQFQKWLPKPQENGKVDPRAEVNKKLVERYSQGYCEWCRRWEWQLPGPQTLHAHHIVEVNEGGSDERENIMILCTQCHTQCHHTRTYLGHYDPEANKRMFRWMKLPATEQHEIRRLAAKANPILARWPQLLTPWCLDEMERREAERPAEVPF